jgi:hypothetical protein
MDIPKLYDVEIIEENEQPFTDFETLIDSRKVKILICLTLLEHWM